MKTYLTSYRNGDKVFASYVRASNIDNAIAICNSRNIGETIDGTTEVMFNQFDLVNEINPIKLYHGLMFVVWVLSNAGLLDACHEISDNGILHDYIHDINLPIPSSNIMKRIAHVQDMFERLSYGTI